MQVKPYLDLTNSKQKFSNLFDATGQPEIIHIFFLRYASISSIVATT